MTDHEKNLIFSLIDKRISQEKFLNNFNQSNSTLLISELLTNAIEAQKQRRFGFRIDGRF